MLDLGPVPTSLHENSVVAAMFSKPIAAAELLQLNVGDRTHHIRNSQYDSENRLVFLHRISHAFDDMLCSRYALVFDGPFFEMRYRYLVWCFWLGSGD